MTDHDGTANNVDRESAIREALAALSVSVTRARYLSEQADVDGQPGFAAQLKAIADRDVGLAHGLFGLLAEPTASPYSQIRAAHQQVVEVDLPHETELYAASAAGARAAGDNELANWMDKLVRAQQDHQAQLRQLSLAQPDINQSVSGDK